MKRTEPDQAELVTIPEAQRRTGLGRRQFRRAIADGLLEVYDVGGWPRLRWTSVLTFIEGTRRATGDRSSDTHHTRERG
jgi:hypothetical protein